jgi:hypothetical protein
MIRWKKEKADEGKLFKCALRDIRKNQVKN